MSLKMQFPKLSRISRKKNSHKSKWNLSVFSLDIWTIFWPMKILAMRAWKRIWKLYLDQSHLILISCLSKQWCLLNFTKWAVALKELWVKILWLWSSFLKIWCREVKSIKIHSCNYQDLVMNNARKSNKRWKKEVTFSNIANIQRNKGKNGRKAFSVKITGNISLNNKNYALVACHLLN